MHIEVCIIKGYFRLIQAYSEPCVTLTYSQPCHILSPGIFRDGETSKTCETLTRIAQNPAITRTVYSGIIEPYSCRFRRLCNPSICRNLAYFGVLECLEPFHNCTLLIQNPAIFTKIGKPY